MEIMSNREMTSKSELLNIVNRANKSQLWDMIYEFEQLGFYREDKRQQRKFIIECIVNCYTTELVVYGECHDDDSLRMERSVIKAMKTK